MISGEYSIYNDAKPQEYRGLLQMQNESYFNEIQSTLAPLEKIILNTGACLFLIGSDGKKERHPQSRSEVFIIQPPAGDLTPKVILKKIPDFYRHFEVGYDNLPCIRTWGDGLLSHSYNNPHHVYPDAILNSRLVFGSIELYQRARQQVLAEMLTHPVAKQVKSQRNEYLKSATTGISRSTVSFHDNTAYYDETPHHSTFGLKPFLRLMQRSLDVHTINLLRHGISLSAADLPSNTAERIEYFGFPNMYWIAYLWFLQQYHHTQEVYKNTRQPVELTFDAKKFTIYAKIIFDLAAAIKQNS